MSEREIMNSAPNDFCRESPILTVFRDRVESVEFHQSITPSGPVAKTVVRLFPIAAAQDD